MLHGIVQWFRGLSGRAKVATIFGAALLVLICVFLSPLVVLGAGLVLLVALLVLVIQALRRRPLGTPAITVGVSLLLVVVFSGISGAIYGTATEEVADRGAASSESSDPGASEREPVPEPEPTQEQQAENTEQETSEEESTEEQASREDEQQSRDATEGEDRDEQENAAAAQSDTRANSGSVSEPGSEWDNQPRRSPENVTSESEPEREDSGLASRGQVVTVTRVVDGDTIEVSPAVDGIRDVRLIGVDTPETYGGEEPLGPQASAFATDALAGEEVALEFDEERVDPYDRALAYVWVSGDGMFNAQLLQEGLAQVATFPPNTRYVDRFESIQADARAAGIGIWGLSPAQQCELADRDNGIGEGSPGCAAGSEPAPQPAPAPDPAPEPAPQPPQGGTGSAPPVSEDDCPGSHPIKGNEDSGIYHPPSGGSYEVTNPETCFASAGAAEAAGYRAAQN